MSNSDDENSDNFVDCPTNDAADKLLSRLPSYRKVTNSRKKNSELRSMIPRQKNDAKKKSTRNEANKKAEDVIKEIKTDIANLLTKFDLLNNIYPAFVETFELMEDRLTAVESEISALKTKSHNPPTPNPTPFRDALTSNDSQRLNKLEYLNSEEDRKKRFLEICFTHPSFQSSSSNIPHEQLNDVLKTTLQLENREIDANIRVRKSKRENTLIATFSHQRFKQFVYRARKKIRTNGNDSNFYLNDNLTSYNHGILMKLKRDRKSYPNTSDPYSSIYSFEGKVYVKLKREPNQNGLHIKDVDQLSKFLDEVKSSSNTTHASTPQTNDA